MLSNKKYEAKSDPRYGFGENKNGEGTILNK